VAQEAATIWQAAQAAEVGRAWDAEARSTFQPQS